MRSLKFLILIAVLFTFCKKEKLPIKFNGEGSALKNGAPWMGKVFSTKLTDSTITINITAYSKEGFERGNVGFDPVLFNTGVFKLNSRFIDSSENLIKTKLNYTTSYSTSLDDGDVMGDVFKLYLPKENILNITIFDTVNNFIAGTFESTYIYDKRYGKRSDHSESDTIIFKNGKFTFKLTE